MLATISLEILEDRYSRRSTLVTGQVSSYIYAEARPSEGLADWIGCQTGVLGGQICGDGAGACDVERLAAPVACAPYSVIHRRSTVSCSPSSAATLPANRPLLTTRSTASRLKNSGKTRRVVLIRLLSSSEKLAWVSTETREDESPV